MIARLVPITPLIVACFALAQPFWTQPLSAQLVYPQQSESESPKLGFEQQTALRCSAAFALVAAAQQNGDMSEFPQLGQRGREFFVQSAARIMDETGMDRAGLAAAVKKHANDLADPADLRAVMPGCLLLLDASGI